MTIPNYSPNTLPEIGVIVARFQVHELHEAHLNLIDHVCSRHKKVIIFLGVPVIQNTRKNPLDFATRKIMLQSHYPDVVILPIKDRGCDQAWSQDLDDLIEVPFGSEKEALLYGGRDSFLPYYKGKHQTKELTTDTYVSGTEVRNSVSQEILKSKDFRAGVIHATYAQRPVTYMTVDIACFNSDEDKILLAKKPNESQYRLIGGFVDIKDSSLECAAKREFSEESGGCEISELEYIGSYNVNDWRYAGLESRIMTTLFKGTFLWGSIRPSDDISELKWFVLRDIKDSGIVKEHREMINNLRGVFL